MQALAELAEDRVGALKPHAKKGGGTALACSAPINGFTAFPPSSAYFLILKVFETEPVYLPVPTMTTLAVPHLTLAL